MYCISLRFPSLPSLPSKHSVNWSFNCTKGIFTSKISVFLIVTSFINTLSVKDAPAVYQVSFEGQVPFTTEIFVFLAIPSLFLALNVTFTDSISSPLDVANSFAPDISNSMYALRVLAALEPLFFTYRTGTVTPPTIVGPKAVFLAPYCTKPFRIAPTFCLLFKMVTS